MTSDVTLTGTAQSAASTQTQSIKLAEDFSQFLTLLTTQLQNQDPLNPMDSTEFTNQLVQFSQVEQAINTNQKLDDLLSLQLGSISSVALGYVGMDVTYTSAEMNWDGAKPVDIFYNMESDASVAKINIYDEEGELVRSMEAPRTSGYHEVQWDGKDNSGQALPVGTYTVKVDAADLDGKPMEKITTAVSGNVRGIESQNGVIFLLVGERAVALGNVIQAKTAPETTTPVPDTGTDTGDTETPDEEDTA
ncbi:flagellar hook assembly protein FlgD [Micavibrio aeruginosavorus]|uniref:Basal-body rod modification protein FlgD n=1 Tax=Micavibrio aeruginosavorus EPB TaxID=349215 RepID=M4VIY6_9BACT|nr:flagellar hook capping FlgD N-terminal domain-containing protein [Micavibrio aeruginosavorus]AGH98455.1 Flagellar basal-body rod modification protein FlgD [Micavibrio aeruginosavorus EPB]